MGRSTFPNHSWLGVFLLTATSPLLHAAEKESPDPKEAARMQTAIAHGLEWLVKSQQKDGSWTLATEPKKGHIAKRLGATSLALLAFSGNGHSGQDGAFKDVVAKGLKQITDAIKVDEHGGHLQSEEGDFSDAYTHGLATIVFCKANATSNEEKLRHLSQSLVDFIVYSQDPQGGGWRYVPQMAGDTSVLGWQFTALKMAEVAGLKVPPTTFAGATKFLDSVQTDGGSAYYYTLENKPLGCTPGSTTTAIGLLCRTYLGWDRTTPALKNGVGKILAAGPLNNIYCNYYATQLMHRYGGDEWSKWHRAMTERLLAGQDKDEPTAGSWFNAKDTWKELLGRLGITTLSLMTLEIGLE